MRAPNGQAVQQPSAVRASDAERDHAIGQLRERFAEGRLTQDSFVFRVEAALRAREHGELAKILADLPPPRPTVAGAALRRLARAGQAAARMMRRRSPAQAPRLLVLPDADAQRVFTIGRDADCDLLITDVTVSRRHAGLYRETGRWLLGDLGSTNGTRLNGWRVTRPVPLRAGDTATFGSMTLVVSERS